MRLVEDIFYGKSFDDVLFRPQYGIARSRVDINTSAPVSKYLYVQTPILSSNMDTVTESKMAISVSAAGGLGFIHRACSIEDQVKMIKKVIEKGHRVGAAIGVSGDFLKRAEAVYEAGANVLLVDIAHAHSVMMRDAIRTLTPHFGGKVEIVAGNVATYDGAKFLLDLGVDAIKVGIGSGSACTTRLETGAGVPQLQAIREAWVASYLGGYFVPIIACGGANTDKDIFLALLAGADTVMSGKLFSHLIESAKPHKYRGMASESVQKKTNTYHGAPEGKEHLMFGFDGGSFIPKVHAEDVVKRVRGHLQSALSYAGVLSLSELHRRITPNAANYLTPLTPQAAKESFSRG